MVFKRETRVISVLLTLFMLFMLWPGAAYGTAPTITGYELDPNNLRIKVTFSEEVYANNDGTGGVTADDFILSFEQNGGALSNVITSGPRTLGNSDPVGGESSFFFYLAMTGGPASGVETIEIRPKADSVFNAAGESIADSETTGAVTLFDKRVEFAPGYPKAGSIQSEGSKQARLVIHPLNETVTAYYVVVPDGADPPDADQVMAGTDSDGNDPLAKGQQADVDTGGIDMLVILPDDATDYDAWVVIEDAAGNITGPSKADLRTPDASPSSNVCEIVGGAQYATLDEALAAVDNMQTIKLLADIYDNDGIVITNGKMFTIDIGGHTLEVTNPGESGLKVGNNSEITLDDSGPSVGVFNVFGNPCGVYVDHAKLTTTGAMAIDGVFNVSGSTYGVYADGALVTVSSAVANAGTAVLALNGSEVTLYGSARGTGGGVFANGSVVTVNGSVESTDSGTTAVGSLNGTIHVSGSVTASGGGSSHGVNGSGSITIDGNVEGNQIGVEVGDFPSVITVGGNVKARGTDDEGANFFCYGALTIGGAINIGGNITAIGGTGARSTGGGDMTIDGTISAAHYIEFGFGATKTVKTIDDKEASTTKDGYYTYTDGYGEIWVKATSGSDSVCEIVGGAQYETLDEALAAVPEHNPEAVTIKLLASITDNDGIEIAWKKINLDLNSYTLAINNSTDNINGKGLEVHLQSEINVTGPGNLNISSRMAGLSVNESSFITSDQVTVNINSQNNTGIYADSDCTIVINGDVSGASAGVYASSGNNITVTGTVTATGTGANHAVFVYYTRNTVSVGSAIVSSGTGAGVYIEEGGNVTVGSQTTPGQVVGKGHGIWTRMGMTQAKITVYGDVEGASHGIFITDDCEITVYGNVKSTSSADESCGVYGFINSDTSNIVVEGNVVGVNGVNIHGGQSTVTVTGNVTASGASTAGNIVSGVRASYASCNVGGNVTANNGTGAYSFEQSEITVDGTISAQKYITVKYDDKAIGDNDASSTKPGYLQYSDGHANAFVWVKSASGPIPVESIAVTGAGNATSVRNGNTLQMNAAVSPEDATDKTVTWSVENGTGTATIDATGLLTGTGAGTVTVWATANDGSEISGSREITITSSGSSGGGGGGGITISKPSVVTGNASSITAQSAVLNGEISSPGGAVITAYGFSYSSDEEQWTEVVAGSDNLRGSFSYTLSGLEANTFYYFKAYATNSAGTSYGAVTSFLVLEEQATMEQPAPPAQTVLRFYIGQNDYYVNDQTLTMDTAPIIVGDRTMMPIRYMAELLGATVNWDGNEQKVTVILNNQTIELWIGQNLARVNGVETAIDENNPEVKPFITPPGRTMLPLRFIARTLGCRVDWDPSVQEVLVTYPAEWIIE